MCLIWPLSASLQIRRPGEVFASDANILRRCRSLTTAPGVTWVHLRLTSLSLECSPGGLYTWIGGMAGVAFKV
jgi:hypothetical protein